MIRFFCYRFFAGGSERSGQQIVGPPKKKSTNEVVEDLFKGAREHGAVPVDKPGSGPGVSSKAKVSYTHAYNRNVCMYNFFFPSLLMVLFNG